MTLTQTGNLATSANNLASSAVTKADAAQATADSNTSAIAALAADVAAISAGPQGPQGVKGDKGDAFTFSDFTASQLDSLKGDQGIQGIQGTQGIQGIQGIQGDKGDAFTFSDFTASQLDSLKGDQGIQGIQGIQGTQGMQGIQGIQGDKGDAFAFSDFTASQLASLKGDQGIQGIQGIVGTPGADGDSAFAIWKSVKGHSDSKTEADFIADLKGDPAEIPDVTKKKTKLSNKIKLPRKKINESKYIPIKDIKGNIKAVSIPHDIIVGTTQTKSDIHVNGDIIADGNIQLSGEIGKFSDARLKSNITELECAQDIIGNITPVTFEWNESGKKESGFIAQNIKDAYPELILSDKNSDMLKLKTTSLAWNAIIISAIKEQQNTIKEQQSQIDELKKLVLELTKNNI